MNQQKRPSKATLVADSGATLWFREFAFELLSLGVDVHAFWSLLIKQALEATDSRFGRAGAVYKSDPALILLFQQMNANYRRAEHLEGQFPFDARQDEAFYLERFSDFRHERDLELFRVNCANYHRLLKPWKRAVRRISTYEIYRMSTLTASP